MYRYYPNSSADPLQPERPGFCSYYLVETYIAEYNRLFAIEPLEEGSAFVADTAGVWRETLCVIEERVVANDNTIAWNGRRLQIPPSRLRPHFVKPIELLSGSNLLYLLKEHANIDAKIVMPDDWRDPENDQLRILIYSARLAGVIAFSFLREIRSAIQQDRLRSKNRTFDLESKSGREGSLNRRWRSATAVDKLRSLSPKIIPTTNQPVNKRSPARCRDVARDV